MKASPGSLVLAISPIFLPILLITNLALAESTTTTRRSRTSKTTVTTTQSNTEGDEYSESALAPAVTTATYSNEISESEVSTVFGSQATSGLAGCKTEELSKGVVKGLKDDCRAWVKDQKGDLGRRFLTSSCEETCTDCGMSLERCNVTGTVRYHKSSQP